MSARIAVNENYKTTLLAGVTNQGTYHLRAKIYDGRYRFGSGEYRPSIHPYLV